MVRIGRLPIGIIVGIILSFFLAYGFSGWVGFQDMITLLQTDLSTGLYTWVGKAFSLELNIFGLFFNFPSDFAGIISGIFSSNMLAWIFTSGIAAFIVKGAKRSVLVSVIVFVVYFLLFLLFGILSGVDLLSMFSEISTIGVTIGGAIGVLLGGFLFGLLSGPYEGLM